MTVNHDVTGSSPVGGAKKIRHTVWCALSFCFLMASIINTNVYSQAFHRLSVAKSVVCCRPPPVADEGRRAEVPRSKSLVTHRHGQRFWMPQPSPRPNPDNISLGSLYITGEHSSPLRFEPSWGSQKNKALRMRRTVKDSFRKVRALRARELREV